MNATSCAGVNTFYCFTKEGPPIDLKEKEDMRDVAVKVGKKAIESSVIASVSSAATQYLAGKNVDGIYSLSVSQCASSAIRQTINQYTNNTIVRCVGHTLVQAGRNVFRGTDPVVGGIDGLGYCVTSEAAKALEANKYPKAALITAIAGTYATEIGEAWVGCKLTQAQGGTIAPLGGTLRILGNLGLNTVVCGGLMVKGAVTATIVSGIILLSET